MEQDLKTRTLKKDPFLSLFNLFEIEKDQSIVEYFYLSPKYSSSEISMEVKKCLFKINSFTVQSRLSKSQMDGISTQFQYIDTAREVERVLGNEINFHLKKSILNEIKKVAVKSEAIKQEGRFTRFLHSLWGYNSLLSLEDLNEIPKLVSKTRYRIHGRDRRGGEQFIITDPYSASCIQDTPQFVFNNSTVELNHPPSHIRLIGEFLGMPVFIHHDLKDEIIIGTQPTKDKTTPIIGLGIGDFELNQVEIVNVSSLLPETIVQAKLQNSIISVEDTKNFYECVKVRGTDYPTFWNWVKHNPFNVFKNFFPVIGTSIKSLFKRREESPQFGW